MRRARLNVVWMTERGRALTLPEGPVDGVSVDTQCIAAYLGRGREEAHRIIVAEISHRGRVLKRNGRPISALIIEAEEGRLERTWNALRAWWRRVL
jgi:hypothetical protein